MELETGMITSGKVTGITKFGAFVTLAPGTSGLVHISEIANTYVNDVNEHLKVGDEVTVKVIRIDEGGRLNLSIKQAVPQTERPRDNSRGERPARRPYPPRPAQNSSGASAGPRSDRQPPEPSRYVPQKSNDEDFEDKLKKFMQVSDSKMAGVAQYEHRSSRRRGR
ncbi:MAG: S1 RNA-binding domain-containing protein [Oscillospiraceae bacterium]|nr:S1 RNA-binding domain-containing protein [Oscillospiraceae bacterium]